jgi:hypothetical protein
MSPSKITTLFLTAFSFLFFSAAVLPSIVLGADESSANSTAVPESSEVPEPPPPAKAARRPQREKASEKRKYFVPDTDRVDAGVFHVAAVAGGNFYVEPAVDATTLIATGNYYKDFGFQAGVVFDYDYSELPDNIPLSLRGFIGYKYILSSVHVFTFDGVVRRMFKVSRYTNFGLGMGGSAAIWYRAVTTYSPQEEILFLPSFILEAGFDFNPMMVEFKWLVNRIGSNSSLMGFEMYLGIRL